MSTTNFTNVVISDSLTCDAIVCDSLLTNDYITNTDISATGSVRTNSIIPITGNTLTINSSNLGLVGDTISIGNPGTTGSNVTIYGNTQYINSNHLNIFDPLVTYNYGGATGAAIGSGFQVVSGVTGPTLASFKTYSDNGTTIAGFESSANLKCNVLKGNSSIISGSISAGSLSASGAIQSNTLGVTGACSVGSLSVAGTASFNNLTVPTATIPTLTTTNITNSSGITTTTLTSSSVGVTGTISSASLINSGNIQTQTLGVTGYCQIGSLGVTGACSLGSLGVIGTTTLTTFSGNTGTITNLSSTTGNITTVNSNVINNTTEIKSATITASGNIQTQTLGVTGYCQIGSLGVTGACSLGSLGVIGTTTLTTFTGITGTITNLSSTTGNITTVNSNAINNTTEIKSATITASGNIQTQTLGCTGLLTSGSHTNTGNLTTGSLNVSGTSTLATVNSTTLNSTNATITNLTAGPTTTIGYSATNYKVTAYSSNTGKSSFINFFANDGTVENRNAYIECNGPGATGVQNTGELIINGGKITLGNGSSTGVTVLGSTFQVTSPAINLNGEINNVYGTGNTLGSITTNNVISPLATITTMNSTAGNITTVNSTTLNNTGLTTTGTLTCNGNSILGTTGTNTTIVTGQLKFDNNFSKKLTLYDTANNDYQYVGLNVASNTMGYNVSGTPASHIFYAATGPTAKQELARIKGTKENSTSITTGTIILPSNSGIGCGGDIYCVNSNATGGNFTTLSTGSLTATGTSTLATTSTTGLTSTSLTVSGSSTLGDVSMGNLTTTGNNILGSDSTDTTTINGKMAFANVSGKKISLYDLNGNDFQYYGLATEANTQSYLVGSSSASHVFFSGASTTAKTELLRVKGTAENSTSYTTGTLVLPLGSGIGCGGDIYCNGTMNSTFGKIKGPLQIGYNGASWQSVLTMDKFTDVIDCSTLQATSYEWSSHFTRTSTGQIYFIILDCNTNSGVSFGGSLFLDIATTVTNTLGNSATRSHQASFTFTKELNSLTSIVIGNIGTTTATTSASGMTIGGPTYAPINSGTRINIAMVPPTVSVGTFSFFNVSYTARLVLHSCSSTQSYIGNYITSITLQA